MKAACRESRTRVPEGLFEVAAVIYNSLAQCYAKTIAEIEAITGKKYDRIHIVAAEQMRTTENGQTAKATGVPVYAGPTEATAVGNLATTDDCRRRIEGFA